MDSEEKYNIREIIRFRKCRKKDEIEYNEKKIKVLK